MHSTLCSVQTVLYTAYAVLQTALRVNGVVVISSHVVCHDVRTDHVLLLSNRKFHDSSNKSESARLDLSTLGLWAPFEKSVADVRAFHQNAPCHYNKNLKQIYREQKIEKQGDTPSPPNAYSAYAFRWLAHSVRGWRIRIDIQTG